MVDFNIDWTTDSDGVLSITVHNDKDGSSFTWSSGIEWNLGSVLQWLNFSATEIFDRWSTLPVEMIVQHKSSDSMCFEFLLDHDLTEAFSGVVMPELFVMSCNQDSSHVYVSKNKQAEVDTEVLVHFLISLGNEISERLQGLDTGYFHEVEGWKLTELGLRKLIA